MSSFLDLTEEKLEDAIEPKAVDEGEYTLILVDWKTTDSGEVLREDVNGNPYIMPVLEVTECPEADFAKPFTHFLRIPHAEMTKKERNDARYTLRMFWEAFGVDYIQRIEYKEVIGLTAEALLIVQADTGYGEQNRVVKFLTAR